MVMQTGNEWRGEGSLTCNKCPWLDLNRGRCTLHDMSRKHVATRGPMCFVFKKQTVDCALKKVQRVHVKVQLDALYHFILYK